jgi:hypothetical protein
MRTSTIARRGAFALGSAMLAAVAQAQSPGEIRIYDENDKFNWFTEQTDRYYTQGLRVEWLEPERKSDRRFLPGISHSDWCSLICGKGAEQGSFNTGFAIGQNMYTPEDISIAGPQPNDRPWAGLLYGSRIARISYEEPSLSAQRQDRIELSVGIVGPASLAGPTQTEWHRLWGWGLPKGWRNQLRNEPVVQLRYDAALRWPRKEGGNYDIIPHVRANLGNALTSLEADVTGRIGWNLSGFGVYSLPAMSPLEPAAEPITEPANSLRGSRWLSSGNLFLRAGIRAVAHNITLDGNSFVRNDILVERTPFVPEYSAGVEMNLVGNFWMTFQFVRRGSEFKRRNGRPAPRQDFGAITLALKLD